MIQAMLDHSNFESMDYSEYSLEESEKQYRLGLSNYPETCHNDVNELKYENRTCTLRNDWFHEANETHGVTHGHLLPPCGVCYTPPTASGTFKAFASIMFAFAGASTFPTIQADMKQKEKFNMAAYIACISK